MSMQFDAPLGSQHSSYHFDKSLDGVLDISAETGIEEATVLDKFRVDAKNDAARNQLHRALGKVSICKLILPILLNSCDDNSSLLTIFIFCLR